MQDADPVTPQRLLRLEGAHIIDAMNAVGVDYATFGNHEFDYGCSASLRAWVAGSW